jgi:hypothetical protein
MDVDYTAYLQGSLVLDADGHWWHEGVKFKNEKLALFFHHAIQYCPDDGNFYVVIGRQRALFTYEDTALFVTAFCEKSMEFSLNNNINLSLDKIEFECDHLSNSMYINFCFNDHMLNAKLSRPCFQSIAKYVVSATEFAFSDKIKTVSVIKR